MPYSDRRSDEWSVDLRPNAPVTAAGCGDLPNKATVTADPNLMAMDTEIGRASCRERVKMPEAGTSKKEDQPDCRMTAMKSGTATMGVLEDPQQTLGGALTWEIVPGSVTPATVV